MLFNVAYLNTCASAPLNAHRLSGRSAACESTRVRANACVLSSAHGKIGEEEGLAIFVSIDYTTWTCAIMYKK